MTGAAPTFSVVVPAWNDAALVGRAVESVLAQRFADFELIVVDDGSTDDTRERLAVCSDPRLRYVHQEHGGVARARNQGIRCSRGRHLTFLDSDDQVEPDWLASYAEAFAEPRVEVVCSGLAVYLEGHREPVIKLPEPGEGLFDHREVLFLAGTFAARRELVERVGGYVEGLPFAENTEIGIRLVAGCLESGGEVRSIHRALTRYFPRRHEASERARERQEQRLTGIIRLLELHGERFRRHPHLYESHLTLAGVTAIRAGRPREARLFFARAIRFNPGNVKGYGRLLLSLVPGLRTRIW